MQIDKKSYDAVVDVTFTIRFDELEALNEDEARQMVEDLAYASTFCTRGAYVGCDIYELEERV